MDQARQVTVLFADVSDSTKLYESEGDKAAMEAIARCVDQLRQTVESSGGRVVKTIGDEVMAVFPTPDAAAYAASNMQYAIDALPPVGATKLGIRIGFHCGPVIQNDNDIFGDTVNLAARLVEQAGRSQIIISRETSDRLGPVFRSFKRPLYAIHVKGKAEEVELCELIWRHADDVTMSVTSSHERQTRAAGAAPEVPRPGNHPPARQRLDHHGARPRTAASSSPTTGPHASTAPSSGARTNSSLPTRARTGLTSPPRGVRRSCCGVRSSGSAKHGWIAFGQPRAEAEEVVEYFCN